MTVPLESAIFCEGYQDRAFLKGWFEHLGFVNLRELRSTVYDPWGAPVARGQFGFENPSGGFVRVVPCHGDKNVLKHAVRRLRDRETKQIEHLVINRDADTFSGQEGYESRLQESIEGAVRKVFPSIHRDENDDIVVDDGEFPTKISLMIWQAEDPVAGGLPAKQTLERLACTAIVEVYPHRATEVQNWLDSRSGDMPSGPKEFAWSYMAGYYAELNCEAFYSELWSDERIAQALKSRLVACGAWRVAEMLSEATT